MLIKSAGACSLPNSLNFDYTASGGFDLGFNVHMKGPILAATFRF